MTNGCITVNIIAHIIVKNFWEYYVTDERFNNDIISCVVYGDFVEFGDVNMQEIKPYVISFTNHLEGLTAAPGWKWVEKED
jgi:hypothetical protein